MDINDLVGRVSDLEKEKRRYSTDPKKNEEEISSLNFTIDYYQRLIQKKRKEKKTSSEPKTKVVEDGFVLISGEPSKKRSENSEDDWVLLIPEYGDSESKKKQHEQQQMRRLVQSYPQFPTGGKDVVYPSVTPNKSVNDRYVPPSLTKSLDGRGGQGQDKRNQEDIRRRSHNPNRKRPQRNYRPQQVKKRQPPSRINNADPQVYVPPAVSKTRDIINRIFPKLKKGDNNNNPVRNKEAGTNKQPTNILDFMRQREKQEEEFRRKEAEILAELKVPIDRSPMSDRQLTEFEALENQVEEEDDDDEGELLVQNMVDLMFPAEEDDEEISEESLNKEWEFLEAEVRRENQRMESEMNSPPQSPGRRMTNRSEIVEKTKEEAKEEKVEEFKPGDWFMSSFSEDFARLNFDLIRLNKVIKMYSEAEDIGTEAEPSLLKSSEIVRNKRIEKFKSGKIVVTNLKTGTTHVRFTDRSTITRTRHGDVKRVVPGVRRESYSKKFGQYQIVFQDGARVVHFLKSKRSEKIFKNGNRIVMYPTGMKVLLVGEKRKEVLFANGIKQVTHYKHKKKEIVLPDGKNIIKNTV